jgi:hypothetical protein
MILETIILPPTQIACSDGEDAEADEARRELTPDRANSLIGLNTGSRCRPDKCPHLLEVP